MAITFVDREYPYGPITDDIKELYQNAYRRGALEGPAAVSQGGRPVVE